MLNKHTIFGAKYQTMKKVILLFLIMYASNTFSQEKNERFSLNIYCQPSISGKLEKFDRVHEKSKISTQFGIGIDYNLNNKSTLSLGLIYKNRGYALKWSEFKLYPDGIPDPAFSDDLKVIQKNNYNFLSVPLIFKHKIKSINNIKFNALLGVSADYFINGNVKSIMISDGHKSKTTNSRSLPKKINISGLIGCNGQYTLNNKISMFLEPNFDINFFDYSKTDIETIRFWDLGLKIGINYAL